MTQKQNYVYVGDNNFAWIMGISILSLLQYNPDAQIYIISNDISAQNVELFHSIGRQYDTELHLIHISDEHLNWNFSPRKWPPIVFARLFLSEFLPSDVTKIVYLDCDTLIRGDLSGLWDIDMDGYFCCGVKDCISSQYKKNIGISAGDVYINSGVMILDLEKIKTFPMNEFIQQFIRSSKIQISFPDQDILNSAFQGKIKILPLQYNVMSIAARFPYKKLMRFRHPDSYYSEEEYQQGRENPIILHFTGHFWNTRPWFKNSDHPDAGLFLAYKENSPWKDIPLKEKTQTGIKRLGIRLLEKMPECIMLELMGLIHAECYPRYKRFL